MYQEQPYKYSNIANDSLQYATLTISFFYILKLKYELFYIFVFTFEIWYILTIWFLITPNKNQNIYHTFFTAYY